jgi:23S rRNA (uracil1939-C5)-methyltransferase
VIFSDLHIASLAAQGDGEALIRGVRTFVPFTLSGEVVRADIDGDRGTLVDVTAPSPDRIAPVCRHFGSCGGCALQHAGPAVYGAFKREQVLNALASRGLTAEVGDLIRIPAQSRRRATFAATRDGEAIVLGYHQARSQTVIAIEECPVLRPAIVRALPALRALLALALARQGQADLHVTETGHGLDVSIDGAGVEMTAKRRALLGNWVTDHAAILRLTVDDEQIAARAEPTMTFSGHTVSLPRQSFLQAVAEAESEMVRLAREATSKLKASDRIADLYAGLGAFSLSLGQRHEVLAVEWDREAVAALTKAARQPGLRKFDVLRRDLAREPLSVRELEPFAAVLFDPPRAGADAQAKMLAGSSVRTVIAVSCNPATFARDARILVDGGYTIETITPVDQFLFTPHVELVAVFKKGKAKRN